MVTPSLAEPSLETDKRICHLLLENLHYFDSNFTYLSLDFLGVDPVMETLTCRPTSLKMGTEPAELIQELAAELRIIPGRSSPIVA